MRSRFAHRLAAVLLLLLAGCNLTIVTDPSEPTIAPQINFVTATPPPSFITATPFGNPVVATVVPGSPTVPPPASNAADWFINNVVLPVWNFLYTFVLDAVGTLWNFAGARGGLIAQVACCIIPGILAVLGVIRYFLWGRIRG